MSRATWSTRAGSPIVSPAAAPGNPFPSQRSKTYARFEIDAGAEAEPPGEALRDLAVQGERRARDLERVLERVGDHRLTNLRRSSLSHDILEERCDLFGVAPVDECELGARLDVVPEELRLLGRVRRAAERVQQRDVVRVHEVRRRELGELSEADGEDRRPERVLEGLTGAQIGRDRHRADHLRSADGRFALGGSCCRRRGRVRHARSYARAGRRRSPCRPEGEAACGRLPPPSVAPVSTPLPAPARWGRSRPGSRRPRACRSCT